jgi:site-specific DNA recombinase
MLAAIYARKSTDQNCITEENKSVTRQIQHAKAYAHMKGWHVSDEYVYSDDGISGAEFKKRPGLMRLLGTLKIKPPFQVLIVSEESRLGRESIETAYVIKQIVTAGVRLFFSLDDRERTLDTPLDKIMLQLTNFADEMERERARSRTYDALVRKAKAGHVTGGRVFGYVNVDIQGTILDGQGRPRRSHVELRINEMEAEVVREIFRMYAAGHGFTSIAKALNAERAMCPRPRPTVGKPSGWVSSSVRQILLRRLYRGEMLWGRTKKRTPWGVKKSQRRAEKDWIVVQVPQLRIVPEELWQDAQDRWKNVRQLYLRATNGQLHGRPTNGRESPYLFTGFTVCRQCSGSLFIRSRTHGKQRAFHYACTTHYLRGPEKCSEPMLIPMELLDRAILQALERDVLQPSIVKRAIEKALQQLHSHDDDPDTRREALHKDLRNIETELARLATAIAAGGPLPAFLAAVHDREEQRTKLQAELAMLDGLMLTPLDPARMEEELRSYLADWPMLTQRHPAQTRQLLRKLLPRRISVWRESHAGEKRYCYEGEASVGRFFSGLVGVKRFGVPNGNRHTTEHPLSFTIGLLVGAA